MPKGIARRLDIEPWAPVVASIRAKTGDGVRVAADTGPVFAARRAHRAGARVVPSHVKVLVLAP
jgi:hypothetical protein